MMALLMFIVFDDDPYGRDNLLSNHDQSYNHERFEAIIMIKAIIINPKHKVPLIAISAFKVFIDIKFNEKLFIKKFNFK